MAIIHNEFKAARLRSVSSLPPHRSDVTHPFKDQTLTIAYRGEDIFFSALPPLTCHLYMTYV